MRHSLAFLSLGATLLLVGCASLAPTRSPEDTERAATPPVDRDTTVALILADTIQTLQRLAKASPAEQAEIVAAGRAAYERAPLGSAQLGYALELATPGHDARDPERARQLLRELAAQPERLAPAERALGLLELAQLERELGLKAENDRLQAADERDSRERLSAASRRLQAEMDENAKLRRQVEEAQAKLDAIAKIERNITERKSTNEVKTP
jgi:succinate dehydrogenase/fumarate reductase flavoprotein subunit